MATLGRHSRSGSSCRCSGSVSMDCGRPIMAASNPDVRLSHPSRGRSGRMRTMADSASETITIEAPIDRVWSIATDIEGYPNWAHDVKEVVVRARDDEGRPTEVEFRASALGRSTHYTLRCDYSSAPARLV